MRFKMGRKRPAVGLPQLKLRNYLMRSLPPPPVTCDYMAAAAPALSQMYMNDQLGDCVIAGMAHAEGIFTANNTIDPPVVFSNHRISRLYSAIGGYNPNDPESDRGCDELTAWGYWKAHGTMPDQSTLWDKHKIDTWVAIDGTNPEEVRTAIWLFQVVLFGVELPDAWINPAPESSGFIWDVAGDPQPQNGHCYIAGAYEPGKVKISTWGMTGYMTDAAIAKYATAMNGGELYAVLGYNVIAKGKTLAPNGFDWSQLRADVQAIS